jgi:cytochrome c oxidase cbb3-type subunit 3
MTGPTRGWLLLAAMAALVACRREQREIAPKPSEAETASGVVVSDLRPGGAPPNIARTLDSDQTNAYAINEGKRLFESYNCSGCHAHGGGAIGPPLMDERWIYGSEPPNVFATILEGRPNGMPSFRGRIPDFQVSELVAYVRSMSALAGNTWAGGRNDTMMIKHPENRNERKPPLRGEGVPPP